MQKIVQNLIKNLKKRNKLSLVIDAGLLAIIGGVLFFLVFFLRRQQEWIVFQMKVTNRDVLQPSSSPENSYSYAFSQGDVERNELGQDIAKIEKVYTLSTNPNTQIVYLNIGVKAIYNQRTKKYSFRGRPIIYGQPFIFEFSNVKVEGIVTDFPGFLENAEVKIYQKKIEVQMISESRNFSDVYGVRDFEANAVNIGDEVKNSEGIVMAKVIDKKVSPAKRTVFTDSGRSFIVNDLQLKDVVLTLDVQVKEINQKMYTFDFTPLYIGGSLPLSLKNISWWPTITRILDE